MNRDELTPELEQLERQLAGLNPAPSTLDPLAIVFEAGRQSVSASNELTRRSVTRHFLTHPVFNAVLGAAATILILASTGWIDNGDSPLTSDKTLASDQRESSDDGHLNEQEQFPSVPTPESVQTRSEPSESSRRFSIGVGDGAGRPFPVLSTMGLVKPVVTDVHWNADDNPVSIGVDDTRARDGFSYWQLMKQMRGDDTL